MQYVDRVLAELKDRGPGEPEFHQAATEILESLRPVVARHPEYEAAALLAAGDRLGAAKAFEAINGYSDAGERRLALWGEIAGCETVSVGNNHTVGLRSDGTVVAVGDNREGQCDVSDWADIVAVCAGGNHTVGLRSDGTVVITGDKDGKCDVSGWTDIKLPGA